MKKVSRIPLGFEIRDVRGDDIVLAKSIMIVARVLNELVEAHNQLIDELKAKESPNE